MPSNKVTDYATQLSDQARQLNAFLSSLRTLRRDSKAGPKNISETDADYNSDSADNNSLSLFTEEELEWLEIVQIT